MLHYRIVARDEEWTRYEDAQVRVDLSSIRENFGVLVVCCKREESLVRHAKEICGVLSLK
jgi:hypothetical protein